MLCAFAGTFFGARLLKKTRLRTVQFLTGILLLLLALALGAGVV